MGGRNSGGIFGQWLSGMSRMYRYTGDKEMRDKAITLFSEWSKTVGGDGNCRMRHYPFEKLVCGLVDLKRYADCDEAITVLAKVTDWASQNLDRERPGGTAAGGSALRKAAGMVYAFRESVPSI